MKNRIKGLIFCIITIVLAIVVVIFFIVRTGSHEKNGVYSGTITSGILSPSESVPGIDEFPTESGDINPSDLPSESQIEENLPEEDFLPEVEFIP